MTGADALNRHVLYHKRHGGGGNVEPVKSADLIDASADRRGLYRLAKKYPADGLENMVSVPVIGQLV